MDALTSSMAHPESSIENRIRQINETDIARNRFILKCITEAILFCGRLSLFVVIGMIALLVVSAVGATFKLLLIIALSQEILLWLSICKMQGEMLRTLVKQHRMI